ncbi:MAG: HNH endonuclease [Blastocatellia bacterium]
MIRPHVPAYLRQTVIQRARECCEYCLTHQHHSPYSFHIDHVIPLKHGGQTEADNLALACNDCNQHKGTDFATIDAETGDIIPLFNPRRHNWHDHFELAGARINGHTAIGSGTVRILQLNDADRLADRQNLMEWGLYPPPEFEQQ